MRIIARKAGSSVYANLKRVANKSTKAISIARGDFFPFYYVAEYPKSGGTWLSRMVADALQVPFPQHNIFPLGFTCVIQNHWRYNPRLGRSLYLHRDGRDVMTSFYFFRMKRLAEGHPPTVKRFGERYRRLFGRGYDPDDAQTNLPRFIEAEFARPLSARLNWVDHIDSWIPADEDRPRIRTLSYEKLHDNCIDTLQRAVDFLAEEPVDRWLVQTAAYKFSMTRQTGRAPGQEDRRSFIRKGVVGDWVNHFSREAAEVFNDLAGPTLVRLGYESDIRWVHDYSPGRPRTTVHLESTRDTDPPFVEPLRPPAAPARSVPGAAATTAWSSSPLMQESVGG